MTSLAQTTTPGSDAPAMPMHAALISFGAILLDAQASRISASKVRRASVSPTWETLLLLPRASPARSIASRPTSLPLVKLPMAIGFGASRVDSQIEGHVFV